MPSYAAAPFTLCLNRRCMMQCCGSDAAQRQARAIHAACDSVYDEYCRDSLRNMTMVAASEELLLAEQIATMHVDHLQRFTAATCYAGQWIFRYYDRNARLFHQQAIQIAQQRATAGQHHATF